MRIATFKKVFWLSFARRGRKGLEQDLKTGYRPSNIFLQYIVVHTSFEFCLLISLLF